MKSPAELEETGRVALRAAAAGDLEGLRSALRDRASAIKEIRSEIRAEAPSEQLRSRLATALEQGEAIAREIRALKLRAGIASAHLARIRTGLAAGLGSARTRGRVDVSL